MTGHATWRVACKRDSLVLTHLASPEAIYAFDHAGRLFSLWRGARLYRRALDGRIMEKHTDRRGPRPRRHRRFLDPEEGSALTDGASAAASAAWDALRRGEADVVWSLPGPPDPQEADRLVSAAARFDARAADADASRFAAAYAPVSILPPDRYRSLVLQVTEGCHWNRCTFCTFYRDRPFRIKTLDEFATHLEAVAAFFGDGLMLRQGIFLGDANALLLPVDDLMPRLDLVANRLPLHARDLFAFIDVFTGHRRTAASFGDLRARGLRRIYLGLESGDDATLAFLNKPQTASDAIRLVQTARSAGLPVGVIVLAGAGGRAHAARHVKATIATLAAMRLGAGDLVYVSAFAAPQQGPYAERAAAEGIGVLAWAEVEDEADALVRGARQVVARRVRVVRYDVEEFLY